MGGEAQAPVNIGAEVLFKQWRLAEQFLPILPELAARTLHLGQEQREHEPAARRIWVRQWEDCLKFGEAFYIEDKIKPRILAEPATYTGPASRNPAELPFDQGVVMFERPWEHDEEGRQTVAYLWSRYEGESGPNVVTFCLTRRPDPQGGELLGGVTGGIGGDFPGRVALPSDSTFFQILDFTFSKRAATFRVAPSLEGEGFTAREAVKHNPEGPLIVTLRANRASYAGEPGHREVDWRGQWKVRGHLRHLATGATTYVRPHVKGPEGKAMRLKVYDVVR